jgi:hypothetical protein
MSKEIATAIMEGKEVDHMKMETGGWRGFNYEWNLKQTGKTRDRWECWKNL